MTKSENITWENVYIRPFIKDPVGYNSYVWTQDNRMVLTFDFDFKSDEYDKIVDTLNGNKLIKYDNLKYSDGDLFDGDRFLFSIRGWGHLTSKLKLNPIDACKVQDDFGKFILKKLG